ncbi:MAG: hypothetical protein WA553_06790, partial [Methylocella sp.]
MTGGDAARSFEFAEEILNQMTPFVVLPGVCAAAFCSLARRDDRFDFPCGEEVAHFVGVKGLVAEKRAASDCSSLYLILRTVPFGAGSLLLMVVRQRSFSPWQSGWRQGMFAVA